MRSQDTLAIIIPARAEEENIIDTIETLDSRVQTPHDIFVVDDSIDANDNTAKIVDEYVSHKKHIHVLWKKHGVDQDGFSVALTRGIAAADHFSAIIIVMADLCDDPKTIDLMYAKILDGVDVVVGSRYIQGGKKIGGPFIQGVFSWVVNYTLHILTGIPTRDLSNSFKMYKADVLKNISIDTNSGVECSIKMILTAYKKGFHIEDIPTRWIGRRKGASKFKIIERLPRYASMYIWAIRTIVIPRIFL